ncbi:uncharacterized protein LOC62_04G006459 [Vanrija pseudolonga]|uniref:Uncharacterized protein n=1 Tax=Vanrija pseudolonga TaxID=143232 RepID=A0AAF0YEE1_9TREE|nr:hypothetical protein LOC62_04G006459 [Vanrija pseudolonga]
MSLVLRSTVRAARSARQMQVRSLHVENKVDKLMLSRTIPGGNKALAIKVVIYGSVGLSLPFIATKISQDKARGN